MLSRQELFDRAVKPILIQNRPSSDVDVGDEPLVVGLYRAPNGDRCPVGHLIPDQKYRPEMEGVPAGDHMILEAIGVPEAARPLLKELQRVHDCVPVSRWGNAFYGIAKKFKLSPAVVNAHRQRPDGIKAGTRQVAKRIPKAVE